MQQSETVALIYKHLGKQGPAQMRRLVLLVDAAAAAERERWSKRVEEAFYEGFTAPETYNDTLQNSADEEWTKAKASLLRA